MSDTLVVHVNRESPQSIDVESGTFEATGSFAITIRNHGRPVHVHVHLDDELSSIARLETGNHYVDGDSTARVPVSVEGSRRPVSGKIKIVTGYGAQTAYLDVELIEPEASERHVEVDESLSKPQVQPTDAGSGPLGGENPLVRNGPLAALGGFSLLLAIGVASMTNGGIVLVGVFAVLLGVAVAIFLLVGR